MNLLYLIVNGRNISKKEATRADPDQSLDEHTAAAAAGVPGSGAPSPLWPTRSGGFEEGWRTDRTTSACPPCTSPAGTTGLV